MNQVVQHTENQIAEAAPLSDSQAFLQAVERAARDPNVDVGKMERLLDMRRKLDADHAKASYYAAMSEMQDELPVITERGEIKIGGDNKPGQKYAYWEDINKAIKPVLKKYGFALSFRTGFVDTKILVTGILSHKDGHAEETTMHLPADTSGSKNAVQAVGSSTSYGKRYAASALLNLQTGGEDDDGSAGGDRTLNEAELTEILGMMELAEANPEKFVKFMKVPAVKDIKIRDLWKAREALNEQINIIQRKRTKAPA